MRIVDQAGNEVTPDYEKGRLMPEKILTAHHEAVEAVEEQGHYETIATYPNGGKDIVWVVDVQQQEAKEAWDEYEDILRYIPYTPEELEAIEQERNKPTMEDRMRELEEQNAMLSSTNEMLLNCVLEMSGVVYA